MRGVIQELRRTDIGELTEELSEVTQRIGPDIIEVYNLETLGIFHREAQRRGTSLRMGRKGEALYYRPRQEHVARFHPRRHLPRAQVQGREIIDFYIALYRLNKDMHWLENTAPHHALSAVLPFFGISATLPPIEQLALLSPYIIESSYLLAQLAPARLQEVYRMGTAHLIDRMLIRNNLIQGYAVPKPSAPQAFRGGRTALFTRGVYDSVWKLDVTAMYPSIIKAFDLWPRSDELHGYEPLLARVLEVRFWAKKKRDTFPEGSRDYNHYDAMQTHFKRLANTFFGYLGSPLYHFNDPGQAAAVAAVGRELITHIEHLLLEYHCRGELTLLELDTDGIYFSCTSEASIEGLVQSVAEILPEGIDIKLEGPWKRGYFKEVKHYALLNVLPPRETLTVKGVALHGNQLERFLATFIHRGLFIWLQGREGWTENLKDFYQGLRRTLKERTITLEDIVVRKICRYNQEDYLEQVAVGRLNRQAHMELMLKSQGAYTQGDVIAYYV
ncbi:hypothetical protein COY95_01655, partial [Candidatus Woesearchaeota archaeon CG_4_10_14_0_8_um_filter_47_5]